MYRVLLVDDEPWITYGLKHLVNWEAQGFIVIGEAHNGITALDMVQEKKPNVVITDIRMPGLDGIGLMEKISNKNLDVMVIVLSGYAEFEYAQKAVNYGAFDYLLKQVEKDKLNDVLKRLYNRLQKVDALKDKDNRISEDLINILSPYNSLCIADFVKDRIEMLVNQDYQIASCMLSKETEFYYDREVQEYSHIHYLRFRSGRKKVIILMNFDSVQYPNSTYDFIMNEYTLASYIGMSSIGTKNSMLTLLLHEADIALNSEMFIPTSTVRTYKNLGKESVISSCLINIEKCIRENQLEQAWFYINEFYEECIKGNFYIEQILIFYNQVVTLINKYFPQKSQICGLEYCTYYQIVDSFRTIHQFFDMFKSFFITADLYEYYVSNDILKCIMDEIEESFTQDISLQALSQKYNISIGYLSTIIKKQTGYTYTEHIINKRLALAKQLLFDDKLSINSIAEKVGYTDYFYFTKLFKKYIGITPSKYRKM